MIRTTLLFLLITFSLSFSLSGQERFFTKSASLVFDADGPMDDIEKIHAKTISATCVIDAGSGQMEWVVSIRSFKFENALMEEHFNENYLESNKFPKATFKGVIANLSSVKWKEDGVYPVKVQGKMTIHGVTRDLEASGNISVRNKLISASSEIAIALADYDIKVPSVVGFKIAKTAKVAIQAKLEPLPEKKG